MIKFLLSANIFLAFLGITFLHADDSYEQAGDYATALERARNRYQEAFHKGFFQEAENDCIAIKFLEEKLLVLGYSRLLFDENLQPRSKLLQLLELVGMEPLDHPENSLLQINEWSQKNLLRQGERWEAQSNRFEALKSQMSPLLTELGFIKASFPHFGEYEGALLHGALLSRVRSRLYYLIEQWKQGIRFSHLYLLSGERPLEELEESALMHDEDSLLKIRKNWTEPSALPKTECDMMQLVWEQSEIPEDMRKDVHVHLIRAPMKRDSKGKLLRPTTEDTVEYWLKASPSGGRYLAVTNAPYTNRQDLILRTIASKGYEFETIGSGASDQEKAAIFLDELARCIFHIKKISENY